MAKNPKDGTITINKLRKKPDVHLKKEWTEGGKTTRKSGSPKPTVRKKSTGAGTSPKSKRKVVAPKKVTREMHLTPPQPKGITIKNKKPKLPDIKPVAGPKKYSTKPTSSKKSKVSSTKRRNNASKMVKKRAKKTKIC